MDKSKGRWRFTIRELLFAATAMACLIALIISKQPSEPYQPTEFYQAFEVRAVVKSICKETSGTNDFLGGGGRGGSGTDGSQKQEEFHIRVPDSTQRRMLMLKLHDAAEADLKTHGCIISGRGTRSVGEKKELENFSFDYHRGNTRGRFIAHSFDVADGSWHLLVIQDEH